VEGTDAGEAASNGEATATEPNELEARKRVAVLEARFGELAADALADGERVVLLSAPLRAAEEERGAARDSTGLTQARRVGGGGGQPTQKPAATSPRAEAARCESPPRSLGPSVEQLDVQKLVDLRARALATAPPAASTVHERHAGECHTMYPLSS
jgi:hypothetical protein